MASSFSRDLCERVFHLAQSGRASVLAGRIAVLVVGAAGGGGALQDVRIVFWFVLFAWSGLGAAFGPVLLLGLGTDWLTRAGAIAGILSFLIFMIGVAPRGMGVNTIIIS